jgi:hypothetical protein
MRVRAVLQALVVCLVAASASAQVADAPPAGEGGSLTFGSLTLTPSLKMSNFGVDENVFNDATNPKSDFTFTISPRADLVYAPGRFRVSYTSATDYVFYRKYTSERGANQTSSAAVEVGLGSLTPWFSISGVNTRGRPNTEIDARVRHHDRTYEGGVKLRLASRTIVTVTGRRMRTTYDEDTTFRGENLADALNSHTDSIETGVGLQLTPFTAVALVVAHDDQRFDASNDRNAESWRAQPTFTFTPGGILNGSFAIGYRRFQPSSAAVPSYSGLAMQGHIAATFGGRYQANLTTTHDIRYSYEQDAPYYLLTAVESTFLTQITTRFDVMAIAGRQLLGYRQPGPVLDAGTDHQRTLGAGVGFRPRRYLRIGAQAEWSRRSSPRDALRGYTDRRIFSTITWGAVQ